MLPIRNLFLVLSFLTFFRFNGICHAAEKHPDLIVLEKIRNGGLDYDPRIRAVNTSYPSEPVVIKVNMYLRRINELNDEKGEFNIQLTYRQSWTDERFKYTPPNSGVQYVNLINPKNLIWMPDTFFSNEISAARHDTMGDDEFIRVYPDGSILHSVRLTLKLSCPMDLSQYPLDTQECIMRLASYGYTTREVKYEWRLDTPLQVSKEIKVPNFNLNEFSTQYCESATTTGTYSCLVARFKLSRTLSPHLVRIYFPSTMLVLVAYLSFWLSKDHVVARTLLITTALFSLIILSTEMQETAPKNAAGNAKTIDTWTGICFTFLVSATLELVVLRYLADSTGGKGRNEESVELGEFREGGPNGGVGGGPRTPWSLWGRFICMTDGQPEKVDWFFRILYPILFLFFNSIYWPTVV